MAENTIIAPAEEATPAPEVVLNSGHKMPRLGLGTFSYPLPPLEKVTSILVEAIEVGIRHFDTAAYYGTEECVGKAVTTAVDRGLIKGRDEIFVTSKLFMTDNHRDLVVPAIKNTLSKLGLEYVDLYLIHLPVSVKRDAASPFIPTAQDMIHFDMKQVWEAMEECCKLGLTKSIGVSNFSCAKLSKLLEFATIPPAVNQVEMHVAWQQRKMLEVCKEKKIHVCAWSPLGSWGEKYGSNAIMGNPILKEIADAKNKSIAQVALRWIYEQGATPIVKSFNKERIKENLQIFDWELSDEELKKIEKSIQQDKIYKFSNFIFPEGQYKSLEEFWDGEV